MKSPKQQQFIAQELSEIGPSVKLVEYTITGYKRDNNYRLAISSNTGMFTESYIKSVIKLSQQYGFSWYVSDICPAVPNNNLFIIIY